MADDAAGTLYPVDQLRAFTLRAFKTVGVPDDNAAIVTDSLIKANPLATGATAIYYPGEIEATKKAQRLAEGIPIPDGVRRDALRPARAGRPAGLRGHGGQRLGHRRAVRAP